MVGSAAPRWVSSSFSGPVLVYVVACGEGHLGVSIHVYNPSGVAHSHVPGWIGALGVGVLVMAAGLLGFCVAAQSPPGGMCSSVVTTPAHVASS